MQIEISDGREFERRRPDGTLSPLSDKDVARGVIDVSGRLFAPCETWTKDFSGQITAGRIGRPVIQYCPIDWHGSARAERVKRRIAHMNKLRQV